MSEERDKEAGFAVKDRRRFDETGQPREAPEEGADADGAGACGPTPGAAPGAADADLPGLDFCTFLLSLSTSALVHLGETPHPEGQTRKDLPLAKQTIDILGMLKDKTRGNLTDEERKLMDDLLYDLRLRYVASLR